MKLTPWIDWPTKPTRVGWYDVRWGCDRQPEGRLWWSGENFFEGPDAIRPPGYGFWGGDQWRGLAEPPENSHAD